MLPKSENRKKQAWIWPLMAVAIIASVACWWNIVRVTVVPDGRLVMSVKNGRSTGSISGLKPTERLATDGEQVDQSMMVGSPIYFDVMTPLSFRKVTVRLEVETEAPLVEVGALSRADGQFITRHGIMRLAWDLDWASVSGKGLKLWQRNKTYSSIDQVLDSPPFVDRTMVYRPDLLPQFSLNGYVPNSEEREYELSLRGHHRLLVYLDGEDLNFTFRLQDMNRASGEDAVHVAIYGPSGSEAEQVFSLEDDGNATDDQKASGLRDLSVKWTPKSSGYYVVDLATTDDVFIRRLSTRQRLFSFIGRMYLGDLIGYSSQPMPLDVSAYGWNLSATAPEIDGLQTIDLGDKSIVLEKAGEKKSIAVEPTQRFMATERPVVFWNDGTFAVSPESVTVKPYRPLDPNMTQADMTLSDYDYLLTSAAIGDSKPGIIEATFDVAELGRMENGKYRFAVIAPEIERWGGLRVRNVSLTWEREPLDSRSAWWKQFDEPLTGFTGIANYRDTVDFDEYLP